ncbi:MAG: FAD-dependent monooxygenase [Spirochaetales bacterium]|nr:FAD-dependent monooxygenase [Spirochaetales bacterium]
MKEIGANSTRDYHTIIIGAGATGLALANMLAASGLPCLVLERELSPAPSFRNSRAIGIMPPSLAILDRYGIAEPLLRFGVRVHGAVAHGRRCVIGRITLERLTHRFPFVLSLPQAVTESVLAECLAKSRSAEVRRGMEFIGLRERDDCVEARVRNLAAGAIETFRARYLAGCDGMHSAVRESAGLRFRGGIYPVSFCMADYTDRTGWGDEAHFFFTERGLLESFPLPGGRRRWNVSRRPHGPTEAENFLAREVRRRCGIGLKPADRVFQAFYRVYHYRVERYYRGRVLLAGDAAHIMSPIGGQGMNTGFADAEAAALLLTRDANGEKAFDVYHACRSTAARAARRRAALAMLAGTLRGRFFSALRNSLLWIFLRALSKKIPGYCTMLTIPWADPAIRYRDRIGRTAGGKPEHSK